MFGYGLQRCWVSITGLVLSVLIWVAPASAVTYSFQSAGAIGDEGVISGEVTYDQGAVDDAILEGRRLAGIRSLRLDDLGDDAEFSFNYVSPHSGARHSESTICGRNIYDLDNGQPENRVIGGQEGPFFNFDSIGDLAFVDFRSCVGEEGKLGISISERDPQISYSELDVEFGQYKLAEYNYIGNKPPTFTQKNIKIKFTRVDA